MESTRVIEPVRASMVAAVDLPATGVVEVRNPARVDEVVGTYPKIGVDAVDAIVEVAEQAQPAWAALSPQERFDAIAKAVESVEVTGIDELLTRENGKILAEAQRELQYMSFPVKFLAPHVEWLTEGEDLGDSGMHHSTIYRDPFGVVGIIAPWNNPIGTSMLAVAPALLGGNAVVVHFPATAPLSALAVYRQMAAALPAGLLSVISSPDTAVAQAVVEHPRIRKVHFTGSTTVGSLIAIEAAPTLAATTLELGGNDAGIVLDDALDDPAIYPKLVRAAFGVEGQACVALKRLYVPAARVAEVVEGLGAVLKDVVAGDGMDPASTMGPVHTAAARERVQGLVESARAGGAEVHEFGTMAADPEQGHFLLPTVVSNIAQDADLVQEEQFGPTLPVIGYETVDEAVAYANDSEYGLGGSVWSNDIPRASAIARRLEAGMTWINAHSGAGIDGRVPWGGVKRSGVGRGGANRGGLEAFTEPHAVIWPSGQRP
ncbi:aldehyde dehydrogenase family protein [Georgenia sp. AZ-5]|uniref:aldehyde dehydrogenase family protein n=1 Tax=Georgenia sp. AZ-5 TaxID=3367526 RepID=UPI0037540AD7